MPDTAILLNTSKGKSRETSEFLLQIEYTSSISLLSLFKMYRSNKYRLQRAPDASSNVPKPVVLSQKRVDTDNPAEKENDEVASSQDVISSQDVPSSLKDIVATQSRFLSQRHQVTRITQETQIRGKNYFEIALLTSKIRVTDLGK